MLLNGCSSRYEFRKVTLPQVAAEYGVSRDTISRIIGRKGWTHI